MADETGAKVYPEVTLGMELRDSEPFLGVIAIDTWEDGQRGPQWHMGIKPTDRVIQGSTGCLHNWANFSEKKRSKMGILLQATLAYLHDEKGMRVGHGDLLGKVAWFETKTIEFGEDKQTGEKIEVTLHVPVRKASEADMARAQGGEPAVVAEQASFDLGETDALLGVLDGLRPAEFARAAIKSGLSPELKNAIVSGRALTVLQADGLIELDGEGRVRRLATV